MTAIIVVVMHEVWVSAAIGLNTHETLLEFLALHAVEERGVLNVEFLASQFVESLHVVCLHLFQVCVFLGECKDFFFEILFEHVEGDYLGELLVELSRVLDLLFFQVVHVGFKVVLNTLLLALDFVDVRF